MAAKYAAAGAAIALLTFLFVFGGGGSAGDASARTIRHLKEEDALDGKVKLDGAKAEAEGDVEQGAAKHEDHAGNTYPADTVRMTLDVAGVEKAILIALDRALAPGTVDNFVKLVEAKFYDGCTIYRAEKNFVIQGGGGGKARKPSPFKPIKLEAKGQNERGTIAMARTNDPNSASTEFFLNLADNAFLNPKGPGTGYAQFGRVLEDGMAVADGISVLPVHESGGLHWLDSEIRSKPDSAAAEFFINLQHSVHLDPAGPGTGYATFGRVLEDGMAVADEISVMPVHGTGIHKLDEEVVIKSVVLVASA